MPYRIIETHYKSPVILFAFFITIAGWWAWQSFLAGSYAPQVSPYDVRDGFFDAFGRDLGWWLTLIVVLFALFVLELGFKMAKRTMTILGLWRWGRGRFQRVKRWRRVRREDWMDGNLEDWDLGLWQEMEKDRRVRARLGDILAEEERGVDGVDGGA